MRNALTFNKVYKSFGNVKAIEDMSFEVPENKIIGLIGSNGAGKTTTMRLIIKYLLPDSGDILYQKSPITTIGTTNYPIAYIPDVPIYYEELSVLEHFDFICSMYKTHALRDILIHRLELSEHLDKVPSTLSKGNRQKLNVACALLRNYDFLIADEPFSGLDPKQMRILKDILIEQKDNGKTILLSTHTLDIIETICDEIIMIDRGKLLAQGSLQKILSDNPLCNTLEELYLLLLSHPQHDEPSEEGVM